MSTIEAVRQYVCPTCKAVAGRYCVFADGPREEAHYARFRTWKTDRKREYNARCEGCAIAITPESFGGTDEDGNAYCRDCASACGNEDE